MNGHGTSGQEAAFNAVKRSRAKTIGTVDKCNGCLVCIIFKLLDYVPVIKLCWSVIFIYSFVHSCSTVKICL